MSIVNFVPVLEVIQSIIINRWKVVHCQSNTSVNISEGKCKEMWKNNQQHYDTVKLNSNAREEIYVSTTMVMSMLIAIIIYAVHEQFNGPNHPTKTTADPSTGAMMATTASQFQSNLKTFVSASFDVAEMLEDTYYTEFDAGFH